MLRHSTLPEITRLRGERTIVQTAKSGSTLTALGRADVGSTYKNALVFDDGELEQNLISIPRLDDDGCEINIKQNTLTVKKNDKIILQGNKLMDYILMI